MTCHPPLKVKKPESRKVLCAHPTKEAAFTKRGTRQLTQLRAVAEAQASNDTDAVPRRLPMPAHSPFSPIRLPNSELATSSRGPAAQKASVQCQAALDVAAPVHLEVSLLSLRPRAARRRAQHTCPHVRATPHWFHALHHTLRGVARVHVDSGLPGRTGPPLSPHRQACSSDTHSLVFLHLLLGVSHLMNVICSSLCGTQFSRGASSAWTLAPVN